MIWFVVIIFWWLLNRGRLIRMGVIRGRKIGRYRL